MVIYLSTIQGLYTMSNLLALGAAIVLTYVVIGLIEVLRLLKEASQERIIDTAPRLTIFGRVAAARLETLSRRVKALDWQNARLDMLVSDPVGPAAVGGDLPTIEVVRKTIDKLGKPLGATCIAIFESAGTKLLEVVVSGKAGGLRFEQECETFVRPYFERKKRDVLGFHQLSKVLGGARLSFFGYVSVFAEEFAIPGSNNTERAGVLIVLYSRDESPAIAEERTIRLAAVRLAEILARDEQLDVTKAAARLATQESRDKSTFLANMSHDLRAPVTNVKLAAQQLGDLCMSQLKDTSDASWLLDAVCASTQALDEMVETVLESAKQQAGELEARKAVEDVVELARGVKVAYEASARINQIPLSFVTEVDQCFCNCDRRQVRRIIGNLLSNALKYNKPQGKVLVRVGVNDKGYCEVDVVDSGIGMDSGELNKLFKRFSRVGDRRVDGTGLGLALSYDLAKLNSGEITVHSEKGVGSTFVLTIPLHKSDSERLTNNEDAIQGFVLVVDDDKRSAELIARSLEKLRIEARTAFSVKEALRIIVKEKPTAVIADLFMPDGGAPKILAELKRLGETVRLCVVTGETDKARTSDLFRGGAEEVLSKPVEISDLTRWLRSGAPSPVVKPGASSKVAH